MGSLVSGVEWCMASLKWGVGFLGNDNDIEYEEGVRRTAGRTATASGRLVTGLHSSAHVGKTTGQDRAGKRKCSAKKSTTNNNENGSAASQPCTPTHLSTL